MVLICFYFGISLALSHFGKYQAAFLLYSLDTRSETELLIKETDIQKANTFADNIVSRNEFVTVAYSVKARKAYSDGNLKNSPFISQYTL